MSVVLTKDEVVSNDPHSGGPRYLCPLPACADHQKRGHRSLSVDPTGELFHCFRCGAGGQFREFWEPASPKLSARQKSQAAARRVFG